MNHKREASRSSRQGVDDRADTSLRAGSLRRATAQTVPKVLTPHEWEQWYAEHGVPDSHKKTGVRQPRWRWICLLRRRLTGQ